MSDPAPDATDWSAPGIAIEARGRVVAVRSAPTYAWMLWTQVAIFVVGGVVAGLSFSTDRELRCEGLTCSVRLDGQEPITMGRHWITGASVRRDRKVGTKGHAYHVGVLLLETPRGSHVLADGGFPIPKLEADAKRIRAAIGDPSLPLALRYDRRKDGILPVALMSGLGLLLLAIAWFGGAWHRVRLDLATRVATVRTWRTRRVRITRPVKVTVEADRLQTRTGGTRTTWALRLRSGAEELFDGRLEREEDAVEARRRLIRLLGCAPSP